MSKIYSRPRIRLPKIRKPRILFAKSQNRGKYRNYKFIKIFIIVVIAIITIKMVLDAVLPIFDTLCLEKANSIATTISNEQATNVMREHKYEELFAIEKDNEGNICMIKANVSPINEIISDVAVRIQEEIDNRGKDNVEIPIGSFTGFKLLAGKGPSMKLKISSNGNVITDLKSEFISQGINQTLHRVYLQVNCEVNILTPFQNIATNISNQILLAENIIIGNIPSSYYNFNGLEGADTLEALK